MNREQEPGQELHDQKGKGYAAETIKIIEPGRNRPVDHPSVPFRQAEAGINILEHSHKNSSYKSEIRKKPPTPTRRLELGAAPYTLSPIDTIPSLIFTGKEFRGAGGGPAIFFPVMS